MATYYKASGKFSPLAFVLFILIAFTALPLLAFVYAYIIYYNPFIYVSFLMTILFSISIGFVTDWTVVKLGKVRSPILAIIFYALASLIAFYIHWIVWINIIYYNTEVVKLIFSPNLFFELIADINSEGAWSFESNTPVTGFMLLIFWTIEFLMVIGITVFFSNFNSHSKIPFCEQTNEWLKAEELPAFEFIEDKNFIVKNLENGNESIFDEIQLSEDSKEEDHSSFILYTPKNSGKSYLSIDNKHLNYDDKGKPQFNKKSIIKCISVTDSLKSKLREKQNTAPVFKS